MDLPCRIIFLNVTFDDGKHVLYDVKEDILLTGI